MIGITLCAEDTPTCTCTPQISICRPHHCVRLISSAYRGASVSCSADHFANGWVPAQNNSMPRSRTILRVGASVARRSSIASAELSQIPVTISTVLRSNSLCTRGLSPISAITAAASLLSSRVSRSTRANSHSTPMVGRADPAKSMRWGLGLPVALGAGNDTARHALAGVARGHRHLVRAGSPVHLLVAIGRNVREVVRLLVDDDRGLRSAEQILGGKRVGGRHLIRRTVAADLK